MFSNILLEMLYTEPSKALRKKGERSSDMASQQFDKLLKRTDADAAIVEFAQ